MHRVRVRVVEDALDANNTIARANRDDFDRAGVRVVNLMSAPGAGKTTLLERVLPGLPAAVLEGDVQGSYDADRLSVIQRQKIESFVARRGSAAPPSTSNKRSSWASWLPIAASLGAIGIALTMSRLAEREQPMSANAPESWNTCIR